MGDAMIDEKMWEFAKRSSLKRPTRPPIRPHHHQALNPSSPQTYPHLLPTYPPPSPSQILVAITIKAPRIYADLHLRVFPILADLCPTPE
ncbi:hypothetical protein CVT25_004481 [Psilocybe cyanescens]|uniref:Uncharacterized protein n=1 Tax=Psilocybe cyanescens TaxID=93625 RepID=A0A409X2I1_PSICY|nr:hypothetical protein CVT25_004481 [Psilocybe cyanescens]